jgi:hypothetical protein
MNWIVYIIEVYPIQKVVTILRFLMKLILSNPANYILRSVEGDILYAFLNALLKV